MDKVKVRLSDLYNAEASGKVPAGYVEDCLNKALIVEDEFAVFSVDTYRDLGSKYRKPSSLAVPTVRLP